MCGITGWIDWNKDLTLHPAILEDMTETLTPRGPDASGTWISAHCALGHRRLSVIDPENGSQPMEYSLGDQNFIIVYNGELYNTIELRQELRSRGHSFRSHCDTEVLLHTYIEWGKACLDRLNGIYAFAIWDSKEQNLFMARDRVGVKPLFYAIREGMFLFGSEPKSILAHPDFNPEVSSEGLAEIFIIGPARTPGHGIYLHMNELRPGCYLEYNRNGLKLAAYWKLESKPHEDNAEKTAATVRELLKDTVERQLISDVPVCTLLSGGLDSSALTAFAANYYKETGRGKIDTYSVDYVDNDKFFKENLFQPNSDAPWIKRMTEVLETEHHTIKIDTPELVDALDAAVFARDLPGYADVDSSLYLFCREIKKDATVAISGEAADEIFGGYPWFHRKESLDADTFPWALATAQRAELLSPELIDWINPVQYVADRYHKALEEVPRLQGENRQQSRLREMSYLNITRFMTTLLDRKDRMSMRVGLEVRVPFCDHRLIEYVWNIPWEIKNYGNREKGILRKAMVGILPDDVISRKKSPYPKTHNPSYLETVRRLLINILNDSNSPILQFLNTDKIRKITNMDVGEFNLPWFGQLMTGPQLLAYLIQVNTWLKEYKVTIR